MKKKLPKYTNRFIKLRKSWNPSQYKIYNNSCKKTFLLDQIEYINNIFELKKPLNINRLLFL